MRLFSLAAAAALALGVTAQDHPNFYLAFTTPASGTKAGNLTIRWEVKYPPSTDVTVRLRQNNGENYEVIGQEVLQTIKAGSTGATGSFTLPFTPGLRFVGCITPPFNYCGQSGKFTIT